jgi:hypothetical protein
MEIAPEWWFESQYKRIVVVLSTTFPAAFGPLVILRVYVFQAWDVGVLVNPQTSMGIEVPLEEAVYSVISRCDISFLVY